MKIYNLDFYSKLGWIRILGTSDAIHEIKFTDRERKIERNVPSTLLRCKKQLENYFDGKMKSFELPLYLDGTPFQKKVWSALIKIPYGKTVSYSDIAKKIKNKNAVRAVGSANGKNKFPILIPCHRVISKNGTLGGYSSGERIKKWLLEHEK